MLSVVQCHPDDEPKGGSTAADVAMSLARSCCCLSHVKSSFCGQNDGNKSLGAVSTAAKNELTLRTISCLWNKKPPLWVQ